MAGEELAASIERRRIELEKLSEEELRARTTKAIAKGRVLEKALMDAPSSPLLGEPEHTDGTPKPPFSTRPGIRGDDRPPIQPNLLQEGNRLYSIRAVTLGEPGTFHLLNIAITDRSTLDLVGTDSHTEGSLSPLDGLATVYSSGTNELLASLDPKTIATFEEGLERLRGVCEAAGVEVNFDAEAAEA